MQCTLQCALLGESMMFRKIIVGLIVLSFAIGIYVYPQMPNMMASHWNTEGQVDGYMSKFWGLFLMPFVIVGLSLLFIIIPKIDPLKSNIEKFRIHYDRFIILLISYLFLIHIFMKNFVYMCAQGGDFILTTQNNPIIHTLSCEQNLLLKRKQSKT